MIKLKFALKVVRFHELLHYIAMEAVFADICVDRPLSYACT